MKSPRAQPPESPPPHSPRFPGRDPEVSSYAESDTELVLGLGKLVVVGFTHRTAPLAVRSRFAVAREDLPHLARRFKALPGVGGCVLVATCNRLEAYLEIRSEAEAEAAFVDLVGGQDLDGRAILARSLMVHGGEAAVKHLFRVASGLDAMVLGDAQILGQVKEAYRTACNHGTASPRIHKAFHMAFRCAKKVRTETSLGGGARSVAGAAASLLAHEMGGLRGKEFLLVGVNEMTEAAGRRLVKGRAARILVGNRSAEPGRELAAALGAGDREVTPVAPVDWADLTEAVAAVDAVITCTGAPEPVLARADLAAAAAARSDRTLLVMDIAVPPDVEPPAAETEPDPPPDNLRVFDLEDVGTYQEEVEQRRCQAAAAGERIVGERVAAFGQWLRNPPRGAKMERLRDEAEQALAKELRRLPGELPEAERNRLAGFGRTIIKRFLGAVRRIEDGE